MRKPKSIVVTILVAAMLFSLFAQTVYMAPEDLPVSLRYIKELVFRSGREIELPTELPVTFDGGEEGFAPVVWDSAVYKEGLQYVTGTVVGASGDLIAYQPVIILGAGHSLINYFDAQDTVVPVDGVAINTLRVSGTGSTTNLIDGSITVRGVARDSYCLDNSLVKLNGAGKYKMTMYAATDITPYANKDAGFIHFSVKTWRSQSNRASNQEIRTTSGSEPCEFSVAAFNPDNEITELSYTFDFSSSMANFMNSGTNDTFCEFRLKMQVNMALQTDIHILGYSIISLDAGSGYVEIDPNDPSIAEYSINPIISDGVSISPLDLYNLSLRGVISGNTFIIAEDKELSFTANIENEWTYNPEFSRFFVGDKGNATVASAPDGRTVAFKYTAAEGHSINLTDLERVLINCTPDKLPILRITVPLGAGQSINGVINNKNDWIGSNVVGGVSQPITMELEPGTKLFPTGNSYSGGVDIRRRGNSSFGHNKTPYSLRMPTAVSLLGIPATRRYAIIAGDPDPTLNMRNYLTFKTGEKMDGIKYQPRSEYVELYLNGQYRGVYTIVERIGMEENMVNIPPATGSNVTGGWLMEKDVSDKINHARDIWFRAPYEAHGGQIDVFTIQDPDATAEGVKYLSDQFFYLHYALINGEEDYTKYIDQNTWMDYLIAQEIAKNVDGDMKSSTNIYKIADDDAFYMGPFWDFDFAYGNANWESPNPETFNDFIVASNRAPWYQALMTKPLFADAVKERYTKYRNTIYKEMFDMMEETGAYIATAAARDYSTSYLGSSRGQVNGQRSTSLRQGIDKWRAWMEGRMNWLDTKWYLEDPAVPNPNAGKIIINQAYGTDGTGSVSHGFIELYNITDQPISLNGYSVQYATGHRTQNSVNPDTSWKVLDLAGKTIGAHSSFLIRSTATAPNAGNRYVIANADMDWALEFSNRALQVAIVEGTAPLSTVVTNKEHVERVIDMLGAVNTPATPRVPQDPRDPTGATLTNSAPNAGSSNWSTWFDPFPTGTVTTRVAFSSPKNPAVTAPDDVYNFNGSQYSEISKQASARRVGFANTGNNRKDFERIDYRASGISDQKLAQVFPRWSGNGEWYGDEGGTEPVNTADGLIINQIYGSYDGAGSVSHGFIELYNPTNKNISLDDFSLQYAPGYILNRENNEDGCEWKVLDLAGKTIKAYGSFLVRSTIFGPVPGNRYVIGDDAYDMEWDIEFSNRAMQVAIVKGKTPLTKQVTQQERDNLIVDLVGAVNDASINSQTGEPIDALYNYMGAQFVGMSKQKAVRRIDYANTGNNAADFEDVDYRANGINNTVLEQKRPRWSGEDGYRVAFPPIIINQTFGTGSGNTGPISHCFIELYNPTNTDVSLNGVTLQYARRMGEWVTLDLSGYTIKSKHSFLVRSTPRDEGDQLRYTIPDGEFDLEWTGQVIDNNAYAFALVLGTSPLSAVITPLQRPNIIDFVVAINTDYEAQAEDYIYLGTTPFIGISRHASARRINFADTDDDFVDFERIDYSARATGVSDQEIEEKRPRWSGDGAWPTEAPDPTQDNADISAAKAAIEAATYANTQANVGNAAQAKTAVEAIISGLSLNGVTAAVVDGAFVAAVAGTVGNLNGANGSYKFTVKLDKGIGAQQTTIELTLAITATPYDATQDNADIAAAKAAIEAATYTNTQANVGNITQAKAAVQAIINGLSLNGVTATVVDGAFVAAVAGTVGNLAGTNGSYKFTVNLNKGGGVQQTTIELTLAITATPYDTTQDNADIAAAKALIEGATYTNTQTNIGTAAQAKAVVEAIINGLNLNGVTATVVDGAFTAAVAGTVGNLAGTNGSYKFTVNLNKGAGTQQATVELTLVIAATPYDTTQDNADIAAAKALLEAATYTNTQANVANITQAKAAVQAIINGLSLNGVTATVVDGAFVAAVAGTVGNLAGTNGSYKFTVNLNKGAGTQQATVELTLVIAATPYDTTQDNADIAAARALLEAATYTNTQTNVANITQARAIVEAIIGGYNLNGVAATLVNGAFTEAVAGTAGNHGGTNGSFKFTVNLNKGAGTQQTTIELTLVIVATAFVPPPNDTPIFTDGNGNALTGFSAAALVTTMSHENNTGELEMLTMYVAIYSGEGRLVTVQTDSREIAVGQTVDFSVTVNTPGAYATNGYYAQIFLWDTNTFAPVLNKSVFPE